MRVSAVPYWSLSAIILLACSSRARGDLKSDRLMQLVGCYELRGAKGDRVDSGYYGASPRVQLLSDSVFIWRVAARLDKTGRRIDPINSRSPFGPHWMVDSLSDSIWISFHNGFSGAAFILAPLHGSVHKLVGRAQESWDFTPTITPRGTASAVRVRCVE